ncbi:SWIM zinc finger family protein [Bacillus sp. SD088]|uniref:SWIM zinc finger family protein n=1 Tax=Bacillus sp. SD088 TaxID=2782012 RepID=UPI001A95F10C|nr:SWIM zinc finger family protein [Bacillus sp. SD088]MBO0995184.1 SWIM zinc finger family protein [Bacillus sp. SD088]
MNLHNFEKSINQVIIDRGYDYYLNGHVTETSFNGVDEYHFLVEGSEDYNVIVTLGSNDDILFSQCDCPFDFGPICKHQVAAYFELIESNNANSHVMTHQPKLKDVLNDLSKEELITIIEEITQDNSLITNKLILKYANGGDAQDVPQCRRVIRAIVNKYTGRQGFIPYRDTSDFAHEMGEVLDKANATDQISLSFDIASLVLIEAMEAFQYADDSDGMIGFLVNQAINQIEEIAISCKYADIELQKEIFDNIIHLSEHVVFNGWDDFKIALLNIGVVFADTEALRNRLTEIIKTNLNEKTDDEYLTEALLNILFDLVQKYGTAEEANQFLQNHLHYPSFRKSLIEQYLQKNKFEKAIALALDGEKQDQKYAGLIQDWNKLRYKAYKELRWKEEQEKLAKELLLKGNFEYYWELKELTKKETKEFYQELKNEVKETSGWRMNSLYQQLIEAENDLEAILEYVKEHPRSIEKYENILSSKFPEQVIEVYAQYIEMEAEMASNRKAYRRVCYKLKDYKKVAGGKKQEELKNKLRTLYIRRPAFIDELGKI